MIKVFFSFGNSIFIKNLLNFIEANWDISPLGDSYYESENASNTISTNAKRTLRYIRTSNINRLLFGHLSMNSLRTKFDFLCKQIEGSIDVFMISEWKLDDMTVFHTVNFSLKDFTRLSDLIAIKMEGEYC